MTVYDIYIFIYVYIYCIYVYIYTYIYTSIYCHFTKISYGKWKPWQFSLIRLPFAHCAKGSLSFVCLLMKKETEVIHLQKRTKQACPPMLTCVHYMQWSKDWRSDNRYSATLLISGFAFAEVQDYTSMNLQY